MVDVKSGECLWVDENVDRQRGQGMTFIMSMNRLLSIIKFFLFYLKSLTRGQIAVRGRRQGTEYPLHQRNDNKEREKREENF